MDHQPYGALVGSAPYVIQGTFGELAFWKGGLTLLAAFPGTGKTSWLLRMVAEASAAGVPSALICYEHSPQELAYRLDRQAEGVVAGAHGNPDPKRVARVRATWARAHLVHASDEEDTPRSIERFLKTDLGIRPGDFALIAVDYLQRVPVTRLGGLVPPHLSGWVAAVELRKMAIRNGWAVVAAAAVKVQGGRAREDGTKNMAEIAEQSLGDVLGDDRITYEVDRVIHMVRTETLPCGCARIRAHVVKDRVGKMASFPITFWGGRYYPVVGESHDEAGGQA